MEEEDKKQLFAVLAATGVMLDKKLPREAMEMYFSSLKDLTLEQVKAAISKHVNCPDRGQFFPKVADIRYALQGSVETQALMAWSKVLKVMEKHGAYESVVFDDPVIHLCLSDLGGWIQLCGMTYEEETWRQKDFVKLYQAYAARPPERYPGKLIGLFERHNAASGFEVHPARLVGDQEKARQVLAGGIERKELSSAEAKSFVDEARRHADAEEKFRRDLDALKRNEPKPTEVPTK